MSARIAAAAVALLLALSAPAEPPASPVQSGRVEWVSDGDTITVRLGRAKEKVRLVGIDTPELDDANTWWRDLAHHALDYAKARLKGRTVALERDALTADRDKYGRLLRYVVLDDGSDFGEEMIRKGYARAYTRFRFGRVARYKAAEEEARAAGVGRWAPRAGPHGASAERGAPLATVPR